MANQSICKIPGCGKGGHVRRGLCNKHYHRWRNHGDPNKAGNYAGRGEAMRFLLAHMHDDCPKWPFARDTNGYGNIQFKGRVTKVSRVVCELAFGPAPSPFHDAAHNCGKGHEGCFGASCIEWKTKAENQEDRIAHGTSNRGERHGLAKLSVDTVREIRRRAEFETQSAIARSLGISRGTVSDIVLRKRWAWLD